MMGDFDGLFGEANTQKKKLDVLYPWLLKERSLKGKSVNSRALAIVGLRRKVWPMLPKIEANVQLRTTDARQYLTDIDETGLQKAYKTPKRGRVPPAEVTQLEMQFDIQEDVKSSTADRKKIRSKVTTFWYRYRCRPDGVPEWIWKGEDDEWMRGIVQRLGPPPPPAD